MPTNYIFPRSEYWRSLIYAFTNFGARPGLLEQVTPRYVWQGCYQMTRSLGLNASLIEVQAYADALAVHMRNELFPEQVVHDFCVVGDATNNPPCEARRTIDIYIAPGKTWTHYSMRWQTMSREDLEAMYTAWITGGSEAIEPVPPDVAEEPAEIDYLGLTRDFVGSR